MDRRTYRIKWLQNHKRYQKRGLAIFRRKLREAANRIPFNNLALLTYPLSIQFNVNEEAIREAYMAYYLEIGVRHGKKVGRGINKEIRQQKNFESVPFESEYRNFLSNWLLENGGQKITSLRNELVQYLIEFIAKGAEEGKDIRTISRELQKHILGRNFYRWQIERIVRTETTGAANLGAIRAGESSGVQWEKEWISSNDSRTRRRPRDQFDHIEVDGVRVPKDSKFDVQGDFLDYPGDPNGQPANVINCYLPGNYIESNITQAQRSFYSGKAVEIITRRGERLTVTPNHSVLTKNGFIPASQIKIGDNLICNRLQKNPILRLVNNYIKKKFFRVEDVFSSLQKVWFSKKTMVVGLDFDKDGASMHGYIDIVYPKVSLTNSGAAKLIEYFNKFKLKTTSLKSVHVSGFSPFNFFSSRYNSAPSRLMSFLYLSFPLLFRHFRPLNTFAFGLASKINAKRFKSSGEGNSNDSSFIRELVKTDSAIISFDEVVDVRYFDFSGHVYDFSSINGVNIINNIYTSNCRCTVAVVPKRNAQGEIVFTSSTGRVITF